MTSTSIVPGIARQHEYIARQKAAGADDSLIVGAAFVNGIRDLGYKSTATALDELIDNSMQAAATKVHVVFGFEGQSEKKPTAIAVIDDGYGVIPPMLSFAAKWGGTDRENDRKGFGRYGYGLPSSCVSQGERFRVFSRADGDDLYGVCVDLQEIRQGKHTVDGGRIAAPKPAVHDLPDWLQKYVDAHFEGLPHGTIVVIDKLDRLTWVTRDALKRNLLEHMGLIYRNYLRKTSLCVDGVKVDPIDPLFLSPGCRYYDVDEERAIGYDDIAIDVKSDDGKTNVGTIKIRASYLPPRFGYVDKKTPNSTKRNARMSIMDEHEGLIVLRNGRQIEVITRSGWGKGTTWRNTDRYWQIEVDFPAALDEEFSVTTSKQTVRLSDRMWEHLRLAGVQRLISDLQKRHDDEQAELKTADDRGDGAKRASELAMENAAKFSAAKPTEEQAERLEKSLEVITKEAQKKSQETGVPVEDIKKALQLDVQRRPYSLEEQAAPGAPFYQPELAGGQRRVYLNTRHPFYTQVYAGPDSTPELRAALEVLIFVLADGELEASGDRLEFYERERTWWSEHLKTALRELSKVRPEPDRKREGESPEASETEVAIV